MSNNTRKSLKQLKLRQLDSSLRPFQSVRSVSRPRLGWLAEVRNALGMTTAQLGRRFGVTKQRVGALERAEAEGKITLSSLQRTARALGCEFVYAVVPRGSLEETLDRQAQRVATEMVRRTAHSMWLERQESSDAEASAQIRDLAEKLRVGRRSRLWDSDTSER